MPVHYVEQLLASAGLLLMLAVSVLAAERVALVVGNAAYEQEIAALKNPVNDAVAAAQRRLDFEVIEGRDLSEDDFYDKIIAFDDAARVAKMALFFYAGHGLQVDGHNYLAPVDLKLGRKQDLSRRAIELADVMEVILDAHRNNPYSRGRSARGLAAPAQSAKGSLIAYTTSSNAVAEDGTGRNGLYTKHLLRYMQEAGLGVEEMFKKVRIAVEQTPWELSSLTGDFSFTLATSRSVDSGAEAPRLAEERQRVAAERRRLEAEHQLLAEQRRLAEDRQQQEEAAHRQREEARRREKEPGRRFRDCPGCPELVVVPAGWFMMGSPAGENGRADEEGPQHRVEIAEPFAVSVQEVTGGEFARFVRATGHAMGNSCWTWDSKVENWVKGSATWRNPGFEQTDWHPVVCVNWDDARTYARWLSRETGERYRLLSESEWEYAARGGARTARYWGESESDQCRHANGADASTAFDWRVSCNDGHGRTSPVGSYTKNGFGLHDVLGNVWEWVQDCWNEDYAGAPADGRAWERGDCSRRVSRGGAWYSRPGVLRSADRGGYGTGFRGSHLGFRVTRTLTP